MTRDQFKTAAIAKGWQPDRFGHLQHTAPSGKVYRLKLQKQAWRLEWKWMQPSSGRAMWLRARSGYYRSTEEVGASIHRVPSLPGTLKSSTQLKAELAAGDVRVTLVAAPPGLPPGTHAVTLDSVTLDAAGTGVDVALRLANSLPTGPETPPPVPPWLRGANYGGAVTGRVPTGQENSSNLPQKE